MSEVNDGGPAFPLVEPNHDKPIIILGISKREYFASSALEKPRDS